MEQEIREDGLCTDNKEKTVRQSNCQERLHKRNDQRTYGNLWIWTLMKDKTIMEFLDEGKTSQMITCLGKLKLKIYWAFDNNRHQIEAEMTKQYQRCKMKSKN